MLTVASARSSKSTIVRIIAWLFGAVTNGPLRLSGARERIRMLGLEPSVANAALPSGSYPVELVTVVALRDGSVLRLRPIRPDDEPLLESLFARLSPQTVYQRFFASHQRLPKAWYHDFANVDYVRRFALVAEEAAADGVRLRGVARWEPSDEDEAVEIAIVIEDAWQGRGLGTTMLRRLFEIARVRGIHRFAADVLAENHRMLRTFRSLTEIRSSTASHGVVHLSLVPRAEAIGVA